MKLFLLALFFHVNTTYNTNCFNIEIPENYIYVENDSLHKWSSDYSTIFIKVSLNENKENICSLSSKDIEKYKTNITTYIKVNNEQQFKYKLSKINKININNNKALYYIIKYYSENLYGYNLYEYNYIFTTKKYVINFSYTTNKSNNNEVKKIIESLEINDELSSSNLFNNPLNIIIFLSIILLLTIIISNITINKKY